MNMSSPKSYTSQPYPSSQFTPKTPKSFNSQIYSPQPFTPQSFNSQIYSPQPFTPMSYHSQTYSPQPFATTPKRSKTPNPIPQRSLNNSPFETGSLNSSSLNNGIPHSSSTSKLYIRNHNMSTAMGIPSNNLKSLHPPNHSYKHQNKKSAVKVYQHTRKVVNDDNNESVEVSEVTQQVYKVSGSDLQREKTSLYSFTTYTSNDNRKKIKHTSSNVEIHNYLSDSSGSGSEPSSPQMNDSKNNKPKKEKENNIPHNRHKKTNIETIPSQGNLEEEEEKYDSISSKKYNVPLNDTVHTKHHQNRNSIDRGKNNFNTEQSTIYKSTNKTTHRKHYSDYGKYTYNTTNYSEHEESPINIIIRNPDNNIISTSNTNSEDESFKEEFGSPESSYSVFSTSYQKSNTTKDDSISRRSGNYNNSNFSIQNKNQGQASALNSIIISQFDSQNNSYIEYDSDGSQMSFTHGNRKKHKTTTTTTTTYEIIEDIDDDEENEDEDEINEEINQQTIEKYVRFNNYPFILENTTNFNPRALLPAPSDTEVITDKETLNRHIKLRKYSWHTSFFENNGKPSNSMFSMPRYKPEKQPSENNFEKNSYDSLEDKTCYHMLYQFDKEDFIVRLGKALYLYGSPTFRTECTLRSVSELLGLHGEFAGFPTLILLSFSNFNTNNTINSESHLLLTPTGYNLGKLEEVVQLTHELKVAIKNIMRSKKELYKQHLKKEETAKKKKNKNKKGKKDKKGKKGKKNENIEMEKDNDDENDKDSISIEIKKSNSIEDITQISRKRNSRNSNIDDNDISINSNNNLLKEKNNSKESIPNDGSINKISGDSDNEDEDIKKQHRYEDVNIDNPLDIYTENFEKSALTNAINKLDYIIAKPRSFGSVFWQLASFAVAGATASPILFGGTWLDVGVSAFIGLIVGIISFYEPMFFPAHGHILEFLASLGASASLRIIQGLFPKYCINFTADTLSAVLYHLPGLNFTIGFIELASRNMISGTVRLIHSLVTSFMMGAGITMGVHITTFITVPIVLDSTSEQVCETLPSPSVYWYILMFPLLSISLNMMFFANASQFPIMMVTTFISYIVTIYGTKFNFPNEISIIIAALTVGIISNIYAKIIKRLAIIPIIIGVLLLVPGSVGVKGSLAFLIDQNFETGVQFTISMFTVSMWITIGVFLSNLIVFPFKNSEHMGLMTL